MSLQVKLFLDRPLLYDRAPVIPNLSSTELRHHGQSCPRRPNRGASSESQVSTDGHHWGVGDRSGTD